jgi:Arc/MetJ-type ribon-helix-helix transcriptional regulator
MKKKVPFPVSIDSELADWINKESERGQFRNRSHLVEQAIIELKKRKEQNE